MTNGNSIQLDPEICHVKRGPCITRKSSFPLGKLITLQSDKNLHVVDE